MSQIKSELAHNWDSTIIGPVYWMRETFISSPGNVATPEFPLQGKTPRFCVIVGAWQCSITYMVKQGDIIHS